LLLITKHARVLFLAYPRNDYDEPDGALATYVSVLEDYSDAIVAFVTSPKTGVQRRIKFPPRVAELVEACDEAAAALERSRRYANWGCNNVKAIEGPQEPKPSHDEMIAKYGPNFGLGFVDSARVAASPVPAPTWDRIAETYAADPSRIRALTEREPVRGDYHADLGMAAPLAGRVHDGNGSND
jgi:hypothetical protein